MKHFEKVIGYEDIKFELERMIDIMNRPEQYSKLGVEVPKGIMLHGTPGVGKTLLANELIKASGRKAFILRKDKPDGEFVGIIKKTFEDAIAAAPSIVFLDDMDKFSSTDERRSDAEEYVAIQSCMDDVKDKGVFVVATANNLCKFPKSLLRRGRFDRIFQMMPPSGEDAVKIVRHYLDQKKYVAEIDATEVARLLHGQSCATLETIINQAGLYAGYAGRDRIEMDDVIKACLCVVYDTPENNSGVKLKNIERLAYHEAGHAVLTEVLDQGSVVLVSVHNHTGSIGGVTSVYHEDDDDILSKADIEKRIIGLLGGKAAIDIVFGEADMGSSRDLSKAFCLAAEFADETCCYGFHNFDKASISEHISRNKDIRVACDMENYYQTAKKLLAQNRDFLDRVAQSLMEKETLLGRDIQNLKNGGC